ncbi:MAG: PQQ-binding-like beta-propeller repeat protein [Fimbriimonadales bacterium]
MFAWFPSDDQNARQAQYVIEHEGGLLRVRVDQRYGGRWVLLNRIPVEMRSGRTYEIEVNNFSPEDVTAGAQRVIADAIRVVNADGLNNAVFSTPAVGRVRVRDGNSTVTRWVVVFGAQNGAVYAVDALGDGENGTRRGETKIYWIVKPASSTSFSYASPLILENDNLVAIGNPSGSVYLINTDLDPQNPSTYFRWEYSRFGAAFVSTPAYDPANRLLYIGSSEGGNQFGRLIALKPFAQDDPNTPQDERVAWVYPPEDQNPAEPITSTPAVALGRVYFTTGGVEGGRLYAVKADNGSLVWARPAIGAPLIGFFSFFYSSPLVVENLPYRGVPTNIVYVGGVNARIIAFNADTGDLLHISENLGGQIFSSPIFTYVRDTDENGTPGDVRPAVVVATNSGVLLALHADEQVNSRNGKAFEGWDLYGNTVFASPAMLDDWLYVADDEGIVYAYNVLGVASTAPETGLGEVIREPERTTTTDGSDYSKLKVSVTTRKADADAVLNGTMRPDELEPRYPEALEWGDTFYVVVWNFKLGSNPQPLRIQLIGPGITRVEYTLAPRQTANPPRDNPNLDYVAVQSVTIQASGSNFYSPGEQYELQVRFGSGGWTSDLALETPGIDRPAAGGGLEVPPYGGDDPASLTTGAGWRFGIANPLALTGVGTVGTGSTSANLFNGNRDGTTTHEVRTRFRDSSGAVTPIGVGEHGKTLFGDYEVRDRRTPQTSDVVPITLNVRAYVDDMRWQGGSAAVIRPLPWEVMPTLPNRSPDYPDISGRRIQMLFEGGTDLQRAAARPLPTGNLVQVQVEIPRFQPANLLGYNSLARVYVDSNNNGRFDGLESVLQPDVSRNLRIEAYREINSEVIVQKDERLFVEEQVIDFGALPGGFGFNWGNLFPNHPASTFRPDNPLFAPFWKTFTVRNEGNVNLYPVYLGKAFGSPQGTLYLFSDMVSFFAGMPAWTTVVSTLDTRFWPQPNPFYPGNSQPYPILQKPQVGDYTSTVLTQPAMPPRRDPNIVVEPRKPQVAIAVPPFQPMGVYSQTLAPYQFESGGTPGVVNGTFATPPMRLVVRVRETQLTGSTNQGVIPMIDEPPSATAPRISDITPAAFRDPITGRLHLYWASNRADPAQRPDNFYLYKATLDWNARNTMQSGVRTTNGWVPVSNNRWWRDLLGPYPADPNGNLFSTALGLGRPLTSAESATIKHYRPFVRITPGGAFLFWTGEVILRNQKYELLFYTRLDPATGAPIGNPQAVPLDPVVPRSSLAITGLDGVGNWLFYVAAPSGRNQIFYIASEGDSFANWRREQRLPLSPIVRSIESVQANLYRVTANPDTPNQNFVYLADVFFIGTVGDRNESEILMQRFYVNLRNGNLLPLSDSRVDRSLGVTQERFLPAVTDEIAQKDPDQNVWRVRHLDWASIDGNWNTDPTTPDLDIKVNGVSILREPDPTNPTQFILQRPVIDSQTGLMQFTYNEPIVGGGGQIIGVRNRGVIVVDPTNGTIRFVNLAPRLNDIVTVTYRPRVYRISAIASGSAGAYSQLRAVFQRTMNPRHNMDNLAASPVRKGVNNGVCNASDRPPVDRVWLFFRRTSPPPNSSGNFFFKTLRPGVRLQSPILTQFGRLPLQAGAFTLAQGTNHAVVQLTPNNVPGAQLGFYEYDALRGNIYFTTDDLGKEVRVRYLARDRAGNIVQLEETLVVRWIDEGNLARSFATDVEYTSPVPIDLPTSELYLWAMPNLEFRQQGSLLSDAYGGLDEALLLFWSSSRNGVGNLYGGAIQPRFYISPFDPDQD